MYLNKFKDGKYHGEWNLKIVLMKNIIQKLARNVHWMVLYQICVFGADLKSNMAARVHNVFSLAEILKIFLSETTKSIERDGKCT
jgi:hypothetical protein